MGNGDCWELADQALRNSGAASSATTGRQDDYVWGDLVPLHQLIPGDILQFRNHVMVVTTTTSVTFEDGSGWDEPSRFHICPRSRPSLGLPTASKAVIWRGSLVLGILLLACATAGTRPASAPAQTSLKPKNPAAATASSGASPGPVRLSPCVLHAGEIRSEVRQERRPGGQPGPSTRMTSCYMNADCIAQRGTENPGDGFVEIQCEGRNCKCRIESLGHPPVTRELAFEADCETSEQVDELLRSRCIRAASSAGTRGAPQPDAEAQ